MRRQLARALAPARRAVADGCRGFARGAGAAPAKDAKEGGGRGGSGGEKSPNLLVRALEPAKLSGDAPSAEQLQADSARAKAYSRQKMAQHRAMQADLGAKLRLRMAALEALPEDLRAAAQEPDFTPFPARRTIPMETPPVPHYFEKLRAAAEEVVSSSALGGGKRR